MGYSHELINGSVLIRNQYTGEVPKKQPFIVNEVRIELMASATGKKLNPQAQVAQKIADEMVFRSFQGEGVEFF